MVAAFERENICDSVGNHMPAKGIQQTCDKPKETPQNNHLRNLPPTHEYFPIPLPLLLHRFLIKTHFHITIQGLEIGS